MVSRPDSNCALAWAPAVLQLSLPAWAGVRHSTRGGQMHRDGCVGRVTIDTDTAEALVRESEFAERVELRRQGSEVQSACSCGTQRCAHAVAALLEVQRRARQAHTGAEGQQSVMAALRQRMQAQTAAKTAEPPRVLRDLERLPRDAAVDMVALSWRTSLRPAAHEVAELVSVAQSIRGVLGETPVQAAALAMRLLQALGAQKIVFTPLPEAAEAVVGQLCDMAVLGDAAGHLEALFGLACSHSPQLAPHAARALLQACARDPAHLRRAHLLADSWLLGPGHKLWREHAQLGGVDLLLAGIVEAELHAGNWAAASDLALHWPPTRSALLILVAKLAEGQDFAGLRSLIERFDVRGATFSAAAEAAYTAAEAAESSAMAQQIANWLLGKQANALWYQRLRHTTSPDQWPELRRRVLAHILSDDEALWLPEVLTAEADATTALFEAVELAPLRERTANSCLALLCARDPLRGVAANQVRLCAVVQAAEPSDRAIVQSAQALVAAAAEVGEPALARGYLALLARELTGRPALGRLFAAFLRVPA